MPKIKLFTVTLNPKYRKKYVKNVCENPHDPLPQQNVKLPSPIKSSTLCKQTPQIGQAYCDTEERLDFSWIKELSAKQRTTKGETNAHSAPAFVKSFRVTTLFKGSAQVA